MCFIYIFYSLFIIYLLPEEIKAWLMTISKRGKMFTKVFVMKKREEVLKIFEPQTWHTCQCIMSTVLILPVVCGWPK